MKMCRLLTCMGKAFFREELEFSFIHQLYYSQMRPEVTDPPK